MATCMYSIHLSEWGILLHCTLDAFLPLSIHLQDTFCQRLSVGILVPIFFCWTGFGIQACASHEDDHRLVIL